MRIPIGIARKLRAFLEKLEGLMPSEVYERDQYLKALSEKSTRGTKAKSKRRATKKAKRSAKSAAFSAIRFALLRRCHGWCEAKCGRRGEQVDHFFGRAREESVESCWWICVDCHEAKTNSRPTAAQWLSLFTEHCIDHGYTAAAEKARSRLVFVKARSFLAEAAR